MTEPTRAIKIFFSYAHEDKGKREELDKHLGALRRSGKIVTPGLPPLRFDTRLRQRTLETPENILTIAILLAYHQELQALLKENLSDEEFASQERQILSSYDTSVQRELAAPYARTLLKQAGQIDIDAQAQRVIQYLRPGPSSYRDSSNQASP